MSEFLSKQEAQNLNFLFKLILKKSPDNLLARTKDLKNIHKTSKFIARL